MKQKVIAQKSKNIHVTEHYILEDRQGTGYIYGGGGGQNVDHEHEVQSPLLWLGSRALEALGFRCSLCLSCYILIFRGGGCMPVAPPPGSATGKF